MKTFQDSIKSHEELLNIRDCTSGRIKKKCWIINVDNISRNEAKKTIRMLVNRYKR